MKQPQIIIIAAIDQNRGLGYQGNLLFNLPEDLQRFKQLTTGHPIIMGRKTYDSIGRILPNRTNIIISRDKNLIIENAKVYNDLNEAITYAKSLDNQIFVIGGAQLYKQALPLANKIFLTQIKDIKQSDVFFPDFHSQFKIITEEKRVSADTAYSFLELIRIK